MDEFKKKIAVVGLGRVGVPLILALSKTGFLPLGYDNDPKKVKSLSKKIIPFDDEPELNKAWSKNSSSLKFTNNLNIISKCEIIFICIGFMKKKKIKQNSDYFSIIEFLKTYLSARDKKSSKSVNFIFRTTVKVGTTRKIYNWLSKQNVEFRYNVHFVPERLSEGNSFEEELTLPKIFSSYSDLNNEVIVKILSLIGGKVLTASSLETAELSKLLDNSYRNSIFALANETVLSANALGIDGLEVISLCNDSYPRNDIKRPGFVSGYCLGNDPYILESSLEERKFINKKRNSIWLFSRNVNDNLIDYCVDLVCNNVKVNNAEILLLGMSFKENVADFRDSHSIEFIKQLKVRNKEYLLHVYDPFINTNSYTTINSSNEIMFYDNLNLNSLKKFKYVVILTNHKKFQNFFLNFSKNNIVFDFRGIKPNDIINPKKLITL